MIDGCSHLVVPEANKPEGRLWLGLDPKTLPCKVFAGPVNTPFADSFAPQPSQPSTFNPRHVQQIPAFLAAWIPFLFPLHCRRPEFPLCFLYIFICSRPRRPAAPRLARLARCCPPFVSAASVWRRVICWPSARQLSNCDHQAPPPQRLLGAPALVPSLCDCQTGQHHRQRGRVFQLPSNEALHWNFLRHHLDAVSFSLSLLPTSFFFGHNQYF